MNSGHIVQCACALIWDSHQFILTRNHASINLTFWIWEALYSSKITVNSSYLFPSLSFVFVRIQYSSWKEQFLMNRNNEYIFVLEQFYEKTVHIFWKTSHDTELGDHGYGNNWIECSRSVWTFRTSRHKKGVGVGRLRTSHSFFYAFPAISRICFVFSFSFLPRQVKEHIQCLFRMMIFKWCSRKPWTGGKCLRGHWKVRRGWHGRDGKEFHWACLSLPISTRVCRLCFSDFIFCGSTDKTLKPLAWNEIWLVDACHLETNLIVFNV